MAVPKDLRAIQKAWKKAGNTTEPGGSGHEKWYAANGDLVTVTSSTPSNPGLVAKKTKTIIARYEKGVTA